jgi:hypothetical protein
MGAPGWENSLEQLLLPQEQVLLSTLLVLKLAREPEPEPERAEAHPLRPVP